MCEKSILISSIFAIEETKITRILQFWFSKSVKQIVKQTVKHAIEK